MWENVFKTDQHLRFDMQSFEFKRHGASAGCESTFNGCQVLQEGQPALQRHILTKNDEVAFDVTLDEFALGTDKKTAVEIIGLVRIGGVGSRLGVIGADDHPGMVTPRQIRD